MPGYTHLQPAQVITPGFYLSALSGELIGALSQLLVLFDEIDLCPLGAGAMAGQELAWDRSRMASLLGFSAPQPHPLTAVAGRAWALRIAAECSTSGVTLSRFVTDLMAWGGGGLRFIELPDRFSGISSAMPQKKNYPVLERIRGRLAHLTAWYVDLSVTQRNTPYANSVEVSKETGSASLDENLRSFCSALALLRLVLEHMEFLPDRMREACLEDYLGGFSLANLLVSEASVPWRTAQVIVGEYIVAAGRDSVSEGAPGLLRKVADRHGYRLAAAEALLEQVGEPERLLRLKQPEASAHPSAVTELLARQRAELSRLDQELALRADRAAENSAVMNTSAPAQTSA
jgi:argininosuccinate lyase